MKKPIEVIIICKQLIGILEEKYEIGFEKQNLDFYNEFQKTLECYAIKINDIGNYNLRLNVYGEMGVFSEVEEFRYLNKNSIVSYKISAKQARFIFLQKLRKFLVGKILTTE